MFMFDPAQEMAERHGRMLASLAELTLWAAQDLHGRLLKAEAPSEAAELGLAFQRVSRSLRQTLLLEAKLAKEHRATAREAAAEAEKAREEGYRERKSKLRRAVTREIAEACESLEAAEDLAATLEEMLEGYVRDPEFAEASLEELTEVLCHDLGLGAPAEDDAAGETGEIDGAAAADEASAEGGSAEAAFPEDASAPAGEAPAGDMPAETPDEAPDAPPRPRPGDLPLPQGPTRHPATGQWIIRDPDHGGWRVVGDTS
jgi:hypothetical protein